MTFSVAIIGRPNVGKSTLFNRLAGKKLALIDDTPGVTRDRRVAPGRIADLTFDLVDTAGFEEGDPSSLSARMWAQTEAAIAKIDVALLMVDGRGGVLPDDRLLARMLRKSGKPVILLVNKCEGPKKPAAFHETFELNCGEPIAFSAAHGEGLGALYDRLSPYAPRDAFRSEEQDEAAAAALEEEDKPLHLAIVGRPNAGKSTLVNRLIGEERMLTGPEPGLTRDAIHVRWAYNGKQVRLVDTAGMRKRARVEEKLEKMSVQETLRAIRLAHVAVLVLDCTQALEKQDLLIAQHIAEEGRALVIALNKWDLVDDKKEYMEVTERRIAHVLSQLSGVVYVPVSALHGKGMDKLMRAVVQTYETWNKRLTTAQLNKWLARMTEDNPPPIVSGRRVKLRYMTQIKARPPTFQLWVNKPVDLPESYLRFLTNGLRDEFDLQAVPVRWQLKKGENPYTKDA